MPLCQEEAFGLSIPPRLGIMQITTHVDPIPLKLPKLDHSRFHVKWPSCKGVGLAVGYVLVQASRS